MKLYNPNTLEKLGFDTVRKAVERRLSSQDARDAWAMREPLADWKLLQIDLGRTQELLNLLTTGTSLPAFRFLSVKPYIRKLAVEGNWLSLEELYELVSWMKAVYRIREFFHKQEEEVYPLLKKMIGEPIFQQSLTLHISALFDDRGKLRDNATPELFRIRQSQQQVAKELRNLLYNVLNKALKNNWTVEREITIRNDRFVIPVKADSKGRVPGFIQDVSQSGQTVFVEPAEALPLNNRSRELQFEEQNEIVRILVDLSDRLRVELPMLDRFQAIMREFEIIRAKALFAQEIGAIYPKVDPAASSFHLKKAFYPPLLMKAKEEEREVVPLNVSFSPKGRIILISGPNAGGKSVSMKTVGLLQVMLQTGMLIPVDEGSVFKIFDNLFIDIGDEQSVASDLSTYTSHLFHLRQMGDHMNQQSLFLIDEFGSGTDPKQGGAIAESFLERFIRVGAYGIITTHYGNIKKYAELHAGVANAAMEFDTEELKPTFRLLEGIPGRSYAFEIAERVGVHRTIIRKARKKVGTEEVQVEKLLEELERKNSKLEQQLRENARRERKLERLVKENDSLQSELVRKRKRVVNDAKKEANELLRKANKDIERTIREIRESQAEKKLTKNLREVLQTKQHEVEELVEDTPKKEKAADSLQILPGPIEVGDWVKLKKGDTQGEVEELVGKQAFLIAGGIRLKAKLNQLEKIKRPKDSKKRKAGTSGFRMSQARMSLDVLGKRPEEALVELDKALDEALLAGFKQFKILHGKGTGVLRDHIRYHLSKLPFITAFYDASEEEGGSGWTVCELKS